MLRAQENQYIYCVFELNDDRGQENRYIYSVFELKNAPVPQPSKVESV